MQPETSCRLFVCQGRCQFAYCSINTATSFPGSPLSRFLGREEEKPWERGCKHSCLGKSTHCRLERWRKAAGKAVRRKNCFLRSQHLLLSRRNMMVSTYFQSLQFHWFCVVVCNPIFLLLFKNGCVDE